jgi:hypothetical protein
MSLFGEPFDSLINIIAAILTGVGGLVAGLLAIIGKLLTIIYYLFVFLEIFISIVINPYLLASFVLGTGLYYAVFTSKTRKGLMMQTGVYYKYVGEAIPKVANAVYRLVIMIINAITNMIP